MACPERRHSIGRHALLGRFTGTEHYGTVTGHAQPDDLPGPASPGKGTWGRAWSTGRSLSRDAARRTARGTVIAANGGRRAVRAVTHAGGAAESGLSRLLELHLVTTIADTLVITALASTIFFAVPTEAARGRVATSLLVTMVPFVVLAPLIGPLLDRMPHGRRYAIAATMAVRAWLAWVMGSAVSAEETALSFYPAAFGWLVCQKAFLVTRAAAVPRVLPRDVGLVAANARISMAGVVAMVVAAPLGAGLTAWLGAEWTLRLAFVVFGAGTALALALPERVNGEARPGRGHSAPEAAGDGVAAHGSVAATQRLPRRTGTPRTVVLALRSNSALRMFSGFLTLFLAFRLRTEPVGGLEPATAVALVIAIAGVGGGIGTALGGLLRRVRPATLIVSSIAAVVAAAAWAALDYGLWAVLVVATVAGLGQALGKLSLDSLIQSDVPERVRTSTFARSETVLQLAWVFGGAVGLVLPLSGPWGLGVAAAGTGLAGLLIAVAEVRNNYLSTLGPPSS
jgi:MFS family permease